ncbi:hypothetical protein GCM10027020_21160 [Nocardioides salsibiostraticola]
MRRLREAAAPLALTVLTVLAVLAVLLGGQHVANLEAEHRVTLLAAQSATVVSAAIEEQLDAATRTAAAPQSRSSPDREVASVPPATLAIARDSGTPMLDETDGGRIVAARYDALPPPGTVEARRESLRGYVVTPLRLADVLADLAPTDSVVAVDGPRQRVAVSAPSGSGATVSDAAAISSGDGSTWSVVVRAPAGRLSTMVWGLALIILLGGGGVATAIGLRQRAVRTREDELRGLQQTHATVARIAVLAQQTRDLGDLLPSMTTELASSLGLRGLSITTVLPSGDRPLFGWGAPPSGGRSAVGLESVAEGETVWLRLARGGRTAARLRVVAGRHLDHYDVDTLVGVADLLASSLTNADAFAEQQNLVERMRAVDELKSVFLGTASHELRTPVVAIAGYSSLLNEKWGELGSEQAHGIVGRIDRNAQQLSQMVEDLLDFSRLERSNPVADTLTLLDLGQVVDQILNTHADLLESHPVTSRLENEVLVSGSHEALERVVTNLVGNAAKYTPPGTPIRVLVREHHGVAELAVEDDGSGVPASDRDRIFSRFYRGVGDAVTRTRGTGLGLAIVTEFAASMGGAIQLQDAESGGARFVVTFPLESRHTPPAPATLAPERDADAAPSGDSS